MDTRTAFDKACDEAVVADGEAERKELVVTSEAVADAFEEHKDPRHPAVVEKTGVLLELLNPGGLLPDTFLGPPPTVAAIVAYVKRVRAPREPQVNFFEQEPGEYGMMPAPYENNRDDF